MNVAPELRRWITDAGFEDVTEVVYVVPLGPWPKDPQLKELGKWESVAAPEAVEAYGLRLFTQILGWSSAEARTLQERVKKQLRERSVHAYTKVYVLYSMVFVTCGYQLTRPGMRSTEESPKRNQLAERCSRRLPVYHRHHHSDRFDLLFYGLAHCTNSNLLTN